MYTCLSCGTKQPMIMMENGTLKCPSCGSSNVYESTADVYQLVDSLVANEKAVGSYPIVRS